MEDVQVYIDLIAQGLRSGAIKDHPYIQLMVTTDGDGKAVAASPCWIGRIDEDLRTRLDTMAASDVRILFKAGYLLQTSETRYYLNRGRFRR